MSKVRVLPFQSRRLVYGALALKHVKVTFHLHDIVLSMLGPIIVLGTGIIAADGYILSTTYDLALAAWSPR